MSNIIEEENKETKICNKCGIEKPLTEFYFRNKQLGIYRPECIECRKKYLEANKDKIREQRKKGRIKNAEKIKQQKKEAYKRNKDKILEKNKAYYKENAERIKSRQKKYNEKNKQMILERQKEYYKKHIEERIEKQKEYYHSHKEERNAYNKEWVEKNKDYVRKRAKKYWQENKEIIYEKRKIYNEKNADKLRTWRRENKKKRKSVDPLYKFSEQTRTLINNCFRKQGYTKRSKTARILGCDFKAFYNHLLETFKNNYGYEWDGKEEVHIDHIIPISTATSEEDIIRLCHYTNLQLLKATDNLKKNDKLDWELGEKEE